MSRESEYRAACARVQERRAVMQASLDAAKARITPARIRQDIKAKTLASILNGGASLAAKVDQRPFATGAAAAAFALYLFRRPLAALFGRLFVRLRDRNPDYSETDDG